MLLISIQISARGQVWRHPLLNNRLPLSCMFLSSMSNRTVYLKTLTISPSREGYSLDAVDVGPVDEAPAAVAQVLVQRRVERLVHQLDEVNALPFHPGAHLSSLWCPLIIAPGHVSVPHPQGAVLHPHRPPIVPRERIASIHCVAF